MIFVPTIVSCLCWQFARFRGGFAEETCADAAPRRRFPIAADVSVLRPYHAAPRNVLFGMRQAAQDSVKFDWELSAHKATHLLPPCSGAIAVKNTATISRRADPPFGGIENRPWGLRQAASHVARR